MNENIEKFVKERFLRKYLPEQYDIAIEEYNNIKPFNANENIFDIGQSISDEAHFIMRLNTQYHLTEVFKAMKVNMEDMNVKEVLEEGNIGTPGRIAKIFTGCNTNDDSELASGRWMKPVRLATFPNEDKHNRNIPITKRIDIFSLCSHHAVSFSSLPEDAYAIISYIPDEYVLGISKLQRLTDRIARRMWLQEDLTRTLYKAVSEAAGTDSVYVKLCNIRHICETARGARSNKGSFTSEYYGGLFTNPEIRKEVKE